MIFQPRDTPLAEDRCNDRRRCGDTRNTNQNPQGLAQVDDVEEPAQEDADDGQRGDTDTKRAGQSVNDALQEVLDGRQVDRLRHRRFSHDDEDR